MYGCRVVRFRVVALGLEGIGSVVEMDLKHEAKTQAHTHTHTHTAYAKLNTINISMWIRLSSGSSSVRVRPSMQIVYMGKDIS